MQKVPKKAHFVGICGVGMSATATLLRELGWEVSGSDEECYPPISGYLKNQKINYVLGYNPKNIPSDADIIVIGRNAKLDPETNHESRSAMESGILVKSFPEVLQKLTLKTHNIICAGSYGKSTCAALMAHILSHAGKEPSYFIGAVTHDLPNTAHNGKSNIFVLEGDEYPTGHNDPSSKFLYYNARDVLLTSAEHDHVNIFPTQKEFLVPFKTLLAKLPKDGITVACTDDAQARGLLNKRMITYALDRDADWMARDITYGEMSRFTLAHRGKNVIELETRLLGKHNVENIVGVSALLLERKFVTPKELSEAVRAFRGVVRRLDRKTPPRATPVYEGFGSSYKKARAAIDAMLLHFPHRRLVVFFEPHTFSWRNRDALQWYDTIFDGVDQVFVYKPAEQGADTHNQLSHIEIVARIRNAGVSVQAIADEDGGLREAQQIEEQNSVVLLLTSGNMGGLIQSLPARLSLPSSVSQTDQ